MKIILALICLSASVPSQEEIRKKKPGWADLGVRVEDDGGRVVVREAFGSDLKVGDVIVELDGLPVRSAEHLMATLWAKDLAKTAKLRLADREVEVALHTISGQSFPGMNNTVHHPPAIRAVAVESSAEMGKGSLKALYAFDFTMSFDWDLTDEDRQGAKSIVEEAARIIFDATEGQMYFRRVEVYASKEAWERAHYRVKKAMGRGGSGVEHVTPGGQCALNFSRLDRTAAIILAHEAGHMQLGSGDEYPYGKADPQDDCSCLMGRGCFNGVFDLCTEANHGYRQKISCWDNLKRWYPSLVRVEKPRIGPELVKLPEVVFATIQEPAEKPDVSAVLARAAEDNRRVLLVWGAVDALADKEVARKVLYEYEVVRADAELGKKYEVSKSPWLVVLAADGKVLEQAEPGDAKRTLALLTKHPCDPWKAEDRLRGASEKAKAEKKRVLLVFGAPW